MSVTFVAMDHERPIWDAGKERPRVFRKRMKSQSVYWQSNELEPMLAYSFSLGFWNSHKEQSRWMRNLQARGTSPSPKGARNSTLSKYSNTTQRRFLNMESYLQRNADSYILSWGVIRNYSSFVADLHLPPLFARLMRGLICAKRGLGKEARNCYPCGFGTGQRVLCYDRWWNLDGSEIDLYCHLPCQNV